MKLHLLPNYSNYSVEDLISSIDYSISDTPTQRKLESCMNSNWVDFKQFYKNMIEICYSGYYDTNQFIQDNQEKINKCFQSIDEIFNIKDEKQMKAELFLQLNQLPNPTNDNYFIAKIMFKQCDDKVNFLQIEHDELGSYKEMYRVLTSSELSWDTKASKLRNVFALNTKPLDILHTSKFLYSPEKMQLLHKTKDKAKVK